MSFGKAVLAQILAGLRNEELSRCARRYPTARKTPALSAYDHFTTMVFAQLTDRESLPDIEVCLNARRPLLYRPRLGSAIARVRREERNEAPACCVLATVAREIWVLWHFPSKRRWFVARFIGERQCGLHFAVSDSWQFLAEPFLWVRRLKSDSKRRSREPVTIIEPGVRAVGPGIAYLGRGGHLRRTHEHRITFDDGEGGVKAVILTQQFK